MLTRKGYGALLDRIEQTGGFTVDMKKDLDSLRADLDERQGILDKYSEEYDGEADSYDFREKPVEDYREQYESLQAEYNGLSARYRDMLDNPHDTHETDTSVDEGEGDTDYSTVTIESLFTEKEG